MNQGHQRSYPMNDLPARLDRRMFLAAGGALAAGVAVGPVLADERPAVREPRATSGDVRVEPNWDERLTLNVGPTKGDLVGTDERVIQAAVDYAARFGGGTIRLAPGTYKLRNAVYLASNIRLTGSGADTVLIKEPSHTAKLKADSDWYDQENHPDRRGGFPHRRWRLSACSQSAQQNDHGHQAHPRRTLGQSLQDRPSAAREPVDDGVSDSHHALSDPQRGEHFWGGS
jgi:hypothetical protein